MANFIQQQMAAQPVVVLIQSIGSPYATTSQWASIADTIAMLGGNQTVFNTLRGGYALVGSGGGPGPGLSLATNLLEPFLGRAPELGLAMEVSAPLTGASGQLNGLLARNKMNEYSPQLADATTEGFNYLLAPIAYQSNQPWPYQNETWYQTAWPILAQQLSLFTNQTNQQTPTSTSCAPVLDFRDNYWCNGTADWSNIHTDLLFNSQTPYPGQDECGCSSAQWSQLKNELADEVAWVGNVQNLLGSPGGSQGELEAPLIESSLPNYIALNDEINYIESVVQPPANSNTASRAFSIISNLLSVASKIGSLVAATPELKSVPMKLIAGSQCPAAANSQLPGVIGAFANVFSLISDFAVGDTGSPLLGQVEAAASGLAAELENNYVSSLAAFQLIGDIIVSDYGKLKAVGNASTCDPNWAWNLAVAQSVNQYLALSAKQFAYNTLLPIVYPIQLFLPSGNVRYPNTSENTVCQWWCYDDYSENDYTPACDPTPAEWMFWVSGLSGSGDNLSQTGVLYGIGTLTSRIAAPPYLAPTAGSNPVSFAFTQGSGEQDGGLLLPYYIASLGPQQFSCPD